MARLRVQTTPARVGKTEEFNSMVREGAELMNSKGINTVVRVSHSGTENIEVYSINFFENWTQYGEAMNLIMTDSDMQAYYFKVITSWSGISLDNSELVEVPGFEKGAETQGAVSISTAWQPIQKKGKTGKFLKSCKQAMEIHEKYGAKLDCFNLLVEGMLVSFCTKWVLKVSKQWVRHKTPQQKNLPLLMQNSLLPLNWLIKSY